jgi:hypothetical protein
MADVRTIVKDMTKQRIVQAVTALLAIVGIAGWLAGIPFSEYLAAAAIIVLTVATVRWVNDEEVLEEEQLQQAVVEKTAR